ncbi:MAG: undecaprenyl-diphosphate phosphatase [Emcibacteraceae bacterium]
MTLLHIIVLAIVQGITEFLPISSSGHLILVPLLSDWPDQGVMMDVGVHVGTLGAVILYFRKDVWRLLHAFIQMLLLKKDYNRSERTMMLAIILATVPVIIFGGLFSAIGLIDNLRCMEVIGWTSIIFGILLYWYDTKSPVKINLSGLKYGHALIIGLAQVLALIPGTSRSGITMTAARALGFSRTTAAHFSMLLSIPTILAAATLLLIELFTGDQQPAVSLSELLWGAGLSFISALLAITFLMKWLQKSSMTPFVFYRVGLGLFLLYLVYL